MKVPAGALALLLASGRMGGAAAQPPHTCAALGCGHHDSVCYCTPTCASYGDCCPDYASACPQKPTPGVVLSDINLLVTTDMHSWLEGRKHQPHLNASIADLETMAGLLRERAAAEGKDVFLFDNGDINDGTGLSASAVNHVDYLTALLRTVSYDALNCGNHELYARGDGHNDFCPITGLQQSGYIESWGGRYLTSNIVQPNTTTPVGSRYTTLVGKHGTKLLVFGFLYDMPDHCPAVGVLKVEEVVRSAWFLAALATQGQAADAIVVLAHMDANDPLVRVIHDAIRASLGPRKPVQFLTGHSHMRKFARLDGFGSSFEAGCKMDTVGFVSFAKGSSTSDSIDFNTVDIDGNTASLAQSLNSSLPALPPSPSGAAVASALAHVQADLGLGRVLGSSPTHYSCRSTMDKPDSLYRLYVDEMVPAVLFNRSAPEATPQWFVFGTGALTYDLYAGDVTIDDAFKASPYANFFFEVRGVPGSVLQPLLAKLNARGQSPTNLTGTALRRHGPERRELQLGYGLPSYVASTLSSAAPLYDVVYCDFDSEPVEAALRSLGVQVARSVYDMPGVANDTSVIIEYFARRTGLRS